jgi:hypothetical protein
VLVLAASTIGARTPASAAGLGAGAIIPLGRRLGEVAPGVLVPDGQELWPRIRPQLLRQLLGLGPEDHAVFLSPQTDPLRVQPDQLLPLDAALLARLSLQDATVFEPEVEALDAGTIRNDHLGRFALWGFGGVPGVGLGRDEPGPGQ